MEGGEVVVLKQENAQLRIELNAQHAVCQKLRSEKNMIYEALMDAKEEIRKLQEELILRDKMFHEMRESKDSELLSIKQMKHELEQRIASIESGNYESIKDEEESICLRFPANLTPSLVFESLSEWDGIEDTINFFHDLLVTETGKKQWKPGSPWNGCWKLNVNMYISAAADAIDELNFFLKDLHDIQVKCNESGFYLTPLHVDALMFQNKTTKANVSKFSTHLVYQSDIFVGILKSDIDFLSKPTIELGYLNSPNAKNALFLFLPTKTTDSNMAKLRERIKKFDSEEKSNVIECGNNVKYGIKLLHKKIINILQKKFELTESLKSENLNLVLDKLTHLEDMKSEWEQHSLLCEVYKHTIPLDTSSIVYDKLSKYVEDTLNTPRSCVLLTQQGSGKTTLLASWIKQWPEEKKVIFIYHFVKYNGSSSAEVCQLYRRLILQMQFYCKDHTLVPRKFDELEKMFFSFMEKLSTISKKSVIVIDGIDYITNFNILFHWIGKSLPSNIRIIVSLNEENCPESWRLLPSPPIPSSNFFDSAELIKGLESQSGLNNLTEDQCLYLGMLSQGSLMWCVIAAKHVISCSSDKSLSAEEVDDLIELLSPCDGIMELLEVIINEIDVTFSGLVCKILQLIYWSRNGLSFNEITKEINFSCQVAYILYELLRRNILFCCGGLYFIPNLQIQDALHNIMCDDSVCNYMLLWTAPLLKIFGDAASLMSRRAEELLWLLKRAELKEELYYAILNVDILIFFFASCRVGEFLDYWIFLDPGELTLASIYYKEIKSIETDGSKNNAHSYFISLYWTVGKIMFSLDYLEEALPILQYSLELCESLLDPDSLIISWILVDLGKLHYLTGRYESSEAYYREALRIHELVYSEDSPQIIHILEDIKEVVTKQKKQSLIDTLSSRIFAIKQSIISTPSAESSLISRVANLESSISKGGIDPVDKAKRMNELGVIVAVFSDFKFAEKNMLEALSILEAQDVLMLPVLKNLGKLYTKNGRLDLATAVIEKAYKIIDKANGDDSQQKFKIVENLAFLYRNQGLIDEAIPLQQSLLTYLIKEFGEEHFCVGEAFNNLAVCYCHLGKFSVALPLLDKAVKLYVLNLGESHPIVSSALRNLEVAFEKVEHEM